MICNTVTLPKPPRMWLNASSIPSLFFLHAVKTKGFGHFGHLGGAGQGSGHV